MNYWIFIVTAHKLDDESYTAEEIFQQRMKDKFWGLGEKTPNRRALQQGDQIIFYVGLPHKVFAGSATISTGSCQLTKDAQDAVSHGTKFYRAEFGVQLDNIRIWEHPRPVEELVPSLKFIVNKESWFAYFQGGVRQITEEDFRTVTTGLVPPEAERLAAPRNIENQAQFALESHLEEFIDRNWNSISFGSNLLRYRTEDQDGRQFPAGPWSIDFLCMDKDTGELVVIELKRGKSSDSTVGQLLRYMGWVKENLSKSQKNVRGLIIAKEVDEALRYAVGGLPQVGVLTYKVDFQLSAFDKDQSQSLQAQSG